MLIPAEQILPTAMGLIGLITFLKTTLRDRDAARDAAAKERAETAASIEGLHAKFKSVETTMATVSTTPKSIDSLTREVRLLDDHLDDIREDLRKLHDTQRLQGERLARLEARIAVHADTSPPESWRRLPANDPDL